LSSATNPFSRFFETAIETLVFGSRWIQAPMYLGLVVGSILYLSKFFEQIILITIHMEQATPADAMLAILGMIDASMVLNLLMIVIVGGYSIFTSKIDFSESEDKPQWLDNLDTGRLKIALASSLALISGVHLLKTYIDIQTNGTYGKRDDLKYEIIIHIVFIVSSLLLAWIERVLASAEKITAEIIGHEPH
jgi:uncharacterized protein (TIGR00645 family)